MSGDEDANNATPPMHLNSHVPLPHKLSITGNIAKNWKKWKQIWDSYEIVTELTKRPDEYRVATFITCIGADALEIYNGLPFENEVDKKNITKVIQLLEKYCLGETNIIYERYVFNNRSQNSDESIECYVTSLRVLADSCEYGLLKDELIRDRIVCGIRENQLRKRLLQECKLTLIRAIDICRAAESATFRVKSMGSIVAGDLPADGAIYAVHSGRQKMNKQKQYTEMTIDCKFCGGKHPKGKERCPAYKKRCSICGNLNHFSYVCRSGTTKPKKQQRKSSGGRYKPKVNYVDQQDSSSGEEILVTTHNTESEATVNAVSNFATKILAPMLIDNDITVFQVDSGATCNVLPSENVPANTKVIPSDGKVTVYGGGEVNLVGSCRVKLVNPANNKKYKVHFMVVKDDNRALLGAKAAQQMELLHIQRDNIYDMSIHAVDENTEWSKNDIMQKYKDVFDGIGEMEGVLHLETDPAVKPVISPPRRVAVALKEPFKKKLQHLTSQGMISKVEEPTPWVSSPVIVKKPSGDIRLCIDPFHLNLALKRSHFARVE